MMGPTWSFSFRGQFHIFLPTLITYNCIIMAIWIFVVFNKNCRKKKHAFNILKQTGVSIIVFWDLYFSNMAPNCCHHLVSTSHSLGEQCPQSTRFPPRPGSVASPQQCLCVPDRSGPSQGTPVTLSRWGWSQNSGHCI